jgi:outer membrane protein assembly factor BamA
MIAALLLTMAIAGPDRSGLQERIGEIRVHGNATISDEAVIALAGVAVGATLDEAGLEAIEKKLRDSGRFDEVQVRKRYRTLAMDEVALLLIVHEKPGVSPTGKPPSAMKRLASSLMFMPILDYEDGYGVTYGARTTIVDLLGKGTHLSVPVSGGGTRKVAVEASHTFKSGPLTRLSGAYGLVERENPHYEIDDRRTSLSGRAERRLFDKLTLGAEAARSNVTFEPSRDRFWSGGADVTLDTRNDPGFPSDAVLATAAWSRLNAMGDTRALWSTPEIDRYKLEARGYKRIFRQTVAAGRVRYDTASAPLPLYEQFLLGGSLLRGLDAGEFAGDARLLWGTEVRAPFTSPLGGGRLGLKAFIDGGTVAPHGARLDDQKMYRGAGGGFFIDSRVFQLHFDVAHSLDGKGTHFHFGTGFTF